MLKFYFQLLAPLSFIGGIIDAIGKNVKADIRMSREKSNQWHTSREDLLRLQDWRRQKLSGPDGRVKDAQDAGIHPLYAIGAPGFQPSPTVSGAATYANQNQARGSYGNVGGAIDAAFASKARTQRQSGMDAEMQKNNESTRRLQDSRSTLNEIEAMRLSSDDAMATRDVWDTGAASRPGNTAFEPIGVEGGEARTFPMGTPGRPINKRPLTMDSNRSSPMRKEVIADDGERYRVISNDYDEIAQFDLPYQIAIRKLYRAMWAATDPTIKGRYVLDIQKLTKEARSKFSKRKRSHGGTLGPVTGFRKRSAR